MSSMRYWITAINWRRSTRGGDLGRHQRVERKGKMPRSRIRLLMVVSTIICGGWLPDQQVVAFSIDHRGGANSVGGVFQVLFESNFQRRRLSRLDMSASGEHDSNEPESKDKNGHSKRNKRRVVNISESNSSSGPSRVEMELLSRVAKLEAMVARQEINLQKLKQQNKQLEEAVTSFARIVELLREAGLNTPALGEAGEDGNESSEDSSETSDIIKLKNVKAATIEYFDDNEIFGRAPASVIDAADAAGAAILAGMLGGKQRMLVDVRDAELSRDPETLVQFIELAILPVAAGLEGLKSNRNRVKIVFPTVSQLLEYRRTMAIAAPEVVALSTLGFDPIEDRDNIVVLVAPSPDDEEGLLALNDLLEPSIPSRKPITQPLVVLNYHMVPVSGPAARFEVAYHLRLLSVQFMTGNNAPEYFKTWEEEKMQRFWKGSDDEAGGVLYGPDGEVLSSSIQDSPEGEDVEEGPTEEEDAALEAAMQHAHELGTNQGVTRAMVIRSFPRPWHIFVDTSPDTDADFEVAATFDEEPTQDDVNYAIVECLEGSEAEDELVAQQMQQALDSGQLDRVSELLGQIPGLEQAYGHHDARSKSVDNTDGDGDDDDLFVDFDVLDDHD